MRKIKTVFLESSHSLLPERPVNLRGFCFNETLEKLVRIKKFMQKRLVEKNV